MPPTLEMTPRERWLALFAGKQPDRIATDYWATTEVTDRLMRELDCPDIRALYRKLHVDRVLSFWPDWKLPHHPDDPEADQWGIRRRNIEYGTGSYDETSYSPLAGAQSVADIHAHRWPDPDDFDYESMGEAIAREDGYYPISAGGYEPFLLYCSMRGLEQAFADLLLNPEIADAALGHIFEVHYEMNRRMFEAGKGRIDAFYLAEDLGSQHGPLFSLETYRRFFRPNQIKMAELVRSYGLHIIYHTDGSARIFLPDLVDVVGIEVLNPIQYVCEDMDREGLARDFGNKIIFHGAMDNQHILPFGTVEDVRQEVRANMEVFRNCRWVCASCHNLQPVTPTENIVAMYETVHELGAL